MNPDAPVTNTRMRSPSGRRCCQSAAAVAHGPTPTMRSISKPVISSLSQRVGNTGNGPPARRLRSRFRRLRSMKTAITDMFGIDVPILAFTHCRDVVAAVTKAGGMGVLGAVAHSPEQLEIDLAGSRRRSGDRPYGVDLIVPAKYAGSDDGGFTLDDIRRLIPAEHVAVRRRPLAPYDVPPLADDSRAPFAARRRPPRRRRGRSPPSRPTRCSRSRSRTGRRSSSTRSVRRPPT